MGDTLAKSARISSILAITAWTLVSIALVVRGLSGQMEHTAPSDLNKVMAVVVTAVTLVAWALTVIVRRSAVAALLALATCGFSVVIAIYIFVEREPTSVPSATSAYAVAVMLFLLMVCTLASQAFGRHDERAAR